MNSSSDDGLGPGLVFLPLAIIIAIGLTLAFAIVAVSFLGFWISIGIGGNLLLRFAIGYWGDKHDASPVVARFGLGAIFLAPLAALTMQPIFALIFVLLNPIESLSIFVLSSLGLICTLLLSTPAYYWTFFAKEIPRLGLMLDLPFKTDAVMHAEAKILGESIKTTISVIRLRLRLYYLARHTRHSNLKLVEKVANGVAE